MNPAPDADLNSVGQENFEWIVKQLLNGGEEGAE